MEELTEIEIKARFLALTCQLSPENLSCDGELSRDEVERRRRRIRADWADLEKQFGRKVTEDQATGFFKEVVAHRKAERAASMAREPQNPLVAHVHPGVWSRLVNERGADAYYIWGPGLRGANYQLFSRFCTYMGRLPEKIGEYDSLDEAVAAGEEFLESVTPDALQRFNPLWPEAEVARHLEWLPTEYRERLPNIKYR